MNVDGLEWHREQVGARAPARFSNSAAKATARNADALVFDSTRLGVRSGKPMFERDGFFIPYGAPVLSGVGTEKLSERGTANAKATSWWSRGSFPRTTSTYSSTPLSLLPKSTRVVVVGDSNYDHATHWPDSERSRPLAASSWLGHLDDQELLDELWANAGVYWHGHSVGGTNPALFQALGAGAPTLALDTPFNREVVAHDAAARASGLEGPCGTYRARARVS